MRLTLATYNIHRCIGADGRYDPERTVRVLKTLMSDVVALQEVEDDLRTGDNFLAYAAKELGMSSLTGPTLLRPDSSYGNALLTTARVLDVRRWDLSYPRREPRGAIDATLDYRGFKFRVMTTHLGLRPGERREQIQGIVHLLRNRRENCSMLIGDLNEWFLWGRPLRWLYEYFQYSPSPATFPAKFPLFALDRIWVRPRNKLVSLEAYRGGIARIASDHLPLKAVIED